MATAQMILASVRDQIPDPLYDSASGSPQVLSDGQLMRQQALVRWLNQAQALVSRETRCVKDWTAVPSVQGQDFYRLDPRFFHLIEVWYDGWPLEKALQTDYYYRGLVRGTAWNWTGHGRAAALTLSVWPFGLRAPGDTFLNAAIGPDDTTLTAVSLAGWGAAGGPRLGWFRIGGEELCTYRGIDTTTNTLSVVSRGQGGTGPRAHTAGARLQECNIWVQGYRIATPVALPLKSGEATLTDPGFTPGSGGLTLTEPLEIPDHFTPLLETYMLAKVREAENERQEASSLFKQFWQELKDATLDARLRDTPTGQQIRPWPIAGNWPRVIIP